MVNLETENDMTTINLQDVERFLVEFADRMDADKPTDGINVDARKENIAALRSAAAVVKIYAPVFFDEPN